MRFLSFEHSTMLKGIGILAVLLAHVGNYSGVTYFTPLGGIGVAIFLFCSGYGLAVSYEKNGLQHFWKKKLTGVYLPYLLIEVAAAAVLSRNIKTVLMDLLLIDSAYVYGWYIPYIFGCYLLFWVSFRWIKNEKLRMAVLLCLAAGSFLFFDSIRYAEQAFSFVGGIFAAKALKASGGDVKYGKLLGFGLLIMSAFLLAVKQLPIVRQQPLLVLKLINMLLKTFAAAGMIYLSCEIRLIAKIFGPVCRFFGRISYALYLTHGYAIFIVADNLFGKYLLNAAVFLPIAVAAAFAADLAIKWLSGAIYKRLTASGT